MIDRWMWLATVASIVGTIANVKRKRWGFGVWAATNAAWVGYDIYKTAYPQAAMMAVYFVLAVWGLWEWKKERTTEARNWRLTRPPLAA